MTIKGLHGGDICVNEIVLYPDFGGDYINVHM